MTSRVAIRFSDEAAEADFCQAVLNGLRQRQKSIPPKFFYDRRGSELFDAICELPEYYLPRAEMEILERHAGAIAGLIAPGAALVEFGSGASRKVRLLLDVVRPSAYVALDLSREFLQQAARRLASDYPWLAVHAVCCDILRPLNLAYPPPESRKLVFFPGSSIGNFEPPQAETFLSEVAAWLSPDSLFVIGVDLKKDPRVLHAAYNDAQGLTAAFNRNLLVRMRRELGADVDVEAFDHLALYNAEAGRVEMYLVSRVRQEVRIGGETFTFEAGERLHTEHSYKYAPSEFELLVRAAGLAKAAVWTDEAERFSVWCLRPA